ncbi:MAG: beta-propeller fold lactonase family protein [Deltaproteobacteria bacterium]|nr:beta-propeller fold lactonase family protein [Deltaproteobacteria bacterium]
MSARLGHLALWLALLALAAACRDPRILDVAEPVTLTPYPNPFGPADPRYTEPPHRQRPQEVLVHADGRRAYVSLPGQVDDPAHQVAVVDIESGALVSKIDVGAGAFGLALHPGGRYLVAFSRFTNFACVIDTEAGNGVDGRVDKVVHRPPFDFYATDALFDANGRLYLTNRALDALLVYDTLALDGGLSFTKVATIPVPQNPRDLSLSPDGTTLAVASQTDLAVSLIDTASLSERQRVDLQAPAIDVAFAGDFLVVPTLSASSHHLPFDGPDGDGDGQPGDGTPNVNFQDLQNEIAIVRAADGVIVHRYTSDTICCKDFRDVDPLDSARHGELLPPRETWIVAGANPEQVVTGEVGGETRAFVGYASSSELQAFAVDLATGALTPRWVVPALGHSPSGMALAGGRLVVANRLSESVGIYDADSGTAGSTVVVGDITRGEFPATDVEIGELINDETSAFAVDGDQSCVMCHRENNNFKKALSMPLLRYPAMSSRLIQAYRGAADTRPWFIEAAMDENNFLPVTNEFARIENFCCSDYTLWPEGAPADCISNPPPECTSEPNANSVDSFEPTRTATAFPQPRPTGATTRSQHFLAAFERLTGRTESFGDGLYFEDPITLERESLPIDFDGVTRALGLFLLASPRLLPNPNDPNAPAALRGKALFESAATGCAVCHPAPTFAVSTDNNPFEVPLRFPPVVTPVRGPNGINYDLLNGGFMGVFPMTEQDTCAEYCGDDVCSEDARACDDRMNLRMGVPTLRGVWDRAELFLHDGRANNLREVLCTPGHPALREGERGFNERDGIVDSHGGTSHLTPQEIDDLIAYLLTL